MIIQETFKISNYERDINKPLRELMPPTFWEDNYIFILFLYFHLPFHDQPHKILNCQFNRKAIPYFII